MLTDEGLTLEGTSNIATLIIEECPGINAAALSKRCPNTKAVRIVAETLRGDGSELVDLMNRKVGGIDDLDAAVNKPVVQTRYELTYIHDLETMTAIENGITGLSILIVIEAYAALIDEVNGEGYGGAEEVDEVTLENIGDHLLYYNGETYDEYLASYANDNMDINDLINS